MVSQLQLVSQLEYTNIPTLQEVLQLTNNNNNYVNLQHVTNLGLYNKLILVTQKQVLELYITVIECKTLYGLCVPHTAFTNATRLQLKQQQKKQQNNKRSMLPR